MTLLLEADRIGRRASADAWLIRGASLVVRAGDRVGLVGPSGSGKSVLLRALAMLDPLDEGEVRFLGRTVHGADVPRFRSRVVYVHQRAPVFEGTVEQNLALPFTLRALRGRAFDRARAVDLLSALGRDEAFLDKEAHDLSGGEAQILALVRVLALDPDVLLLDEPTASLDRETAAAVERVVLAWAGERADARALVFVGHDPDQVSRIAATKLRVERGRVVEAP